MPTTPCPYCIADIEPARLERHLLKVHSSMAVASEEERQKEKDKASEQRRQIQAKKDHERERMWKLWLSKPANQRLHHIREEIGIDPSGIESEGLASFECYLCGRYATRVTLYRLTLKDGTYINLGQDCFDRIIQAR